MEMVFVDTSALIALVDEDDLNHQKAVNIWDKMIDREYLPFAHNYILVETIAIVQARYGMEIVKRLTKELFPAVKIEWVTSKVQKNILKKHCEESVRSISFVDRVSFDFMRQHEANKVFSFDDDFSRQGFKLI